MERTLVGRSGGTSSTLYITRECAHSLHLAEYPWTLIERSRAKMATDRIVLYRSLKVLQVSYRIVSYPVQMLNALIEIYRLRRSWMETTSETTKPPWKYFFRQKCQKDNAYKFHNSRYKGSFLDATSTHEMLSPRSIVVESRGKKHFGNVDTTMELFLANTCHKCNNCKFHNSTCNGPSSMVQAPMSCSRRDL